jgi:glucokinase
MAKPEDAILGIDLGGTSINVGLVSPGGEIVQSVSLATHAHLGPRSVVKMIGDSARDLMADYDGRVKLAGAGAPGPLDYRSGIVVEMPNLGWKDVPLRAMIEEEIDRPTHLDNDANAAAYGEYWAGAGRGAKVLACFTLGTGIGGGIILDGAVMRGMSGGAGEFGHMIIVPGGRSCKCGKYGCLETYASGTHIAARTRERLEKGEESILRELVKNDLSQVSAQLVSKAAAKGDPLARDIMEETARYLALGISNVMNVLNPDVVVLGGGVMGAGDQLLQPTREFVRELTFESQWRDVKIVPAALGTKAGMVGAAGIALATKDRR